MGKQGGVRIIYYVMTKQDEIWMLTLYAKSVHDNIPAYNIRAMKGLQAESEPDIKSKRKVF